MLATYRMPNGGHDPIAFLFSQTGNSTLGLGFMKENFIFSAIPFLLLFREVIYMHACKEDVS
jgi:hypothetical protein